MADTLTLRLAQITGSEYFSSCLRISSEGIRLWTHYDIMDNVLCNIRGRKRVVLWEPSDVSPYLLFRAANFYTGGQLVY